jgi:hypothetical protein
MRPVLTIERMAHDENENRGWGWPGDEPSESEADANAAMVELLEARLKPEALVSTGEPPLEVGYSPTTKWVRWRTSLYVPERFWAFVTDEPTAPGLILEIVVEDGRLVFDRVSFARLPGQQPVRSQDTRRNIDALKREAAAKVAATVRRDPDGRMWLVRSGMTETEFTETYEGTARERGRGVRYTDDELRRTVELYDSLTERREWHAMNELHITRSTLHRQLREARKRGLRPTKKKGGK